MKNEIILYRPDEIAEHIEVRIDEETVWLNHDQLMLLFLRDQSVISRHIRNIFTEGELNEKRNMQKMQIPNSDKELYHLGASLKDLGKKWFAFSRMDSLVNQVLDQLKNVK